MADLILTTFDWVPEIPRGYVRDIRVRWALEEAGLKYSVKGVPFHAQNAEHFAHQPFGQVPWLTMAKSRSSRAAPSCFILASAVARCCQWILGVASKVKNGFSLR